MTAALERGEWSAARPGRTLPPGKDSVPILQEAGWAPGPVCTGGKSRPHRDTMPDRPARSSVAIPTELPGPHALQVLALNPHRNIYRGIYIVYTFRVHIPLYYPTSELRNTTHMGYINSYIFRHRGAIIRELLQQTCTSQTANIQGYSK